MSYVFYIEYTDGKRTEIGFRTAKMAEKAYNLYSKESEDNAKAWGWGADDSSLLSRQIAKKKMQA